MTARLNCLAFVMLAALLFVLPLPLAGNRPWAWSLMESWIFATFIVWLISAAGQPGLGLHRLRPYRLLLAGLAMVQLLVWIQLLPLPIALLELLSPRVSVLAMDLGFTPQQLSLDPGQSAISLFKGISYLLFCALMLQLCQTPRRIKVIALVIVASGAFQAVYASLMLLSNRETSLLLGLLNSDVATGTFVYKNQLANFLVLSSAIAIGYLIAQLGNCRQFHRKARLLAWLDAFSGIKLTLRLCIILMIIALVLTRSRMGNAAFFMSLTLTAVLAWLFYKNRPRSLGTLVASLFVLDVVIIGSWFGLDRVKERLVQTSLQTESRDEVVQAALVMVGDFPLMGAGAGSFYSTFPAYQPGELGGFYDHAHNDYLQFTVELGLLASSCLGGLLCYSLYLSYRTYSRRHRSLYKGLSLGCTMAILAILFHSLVDFSLQAPANALMLVAILALCWLCRYMPTHGASAVKSTTFARLFRS